MTTETRNEDGRTAATRATATRRNDGAMSLAVLLQRVDQLPPLPAVAAMLLGLRDSDPPHLNQLAQGIREDQAITVRVLRVANSPFYGLRREVLSVDEASQILGLSTLRSIALSAALMKPFPVVAGMRFSLPAFWRMTLATAAITEQCNRRLGRDPAIGFTSGLLHAIGVPAWLWADPLHFADRYPLELSTSQRSSHALQTQGWDSQTLGSHLAGHWRLPDFLTRMIALVEMPYATDGQAAERQQADLVHLAARLAGVLTQDPAQREPLAQPEPEPLAAGAPTDPVAAAFAADPADPAVFARVGLDHAVLLECVLAARPAYQRLAAMVG